MEIRVLKYFLAVAQEGSVTKAANYLYLTQPTLSRQIQDLEKELGQKLLIRTNHNVSLTQEGMVLKKRAQEILDMVEKTQNEFSSLKNTLSGDIYIGCGETDSMRQIAQIFNDMHKKHPKIKYHINSGNADDIIEKLDKGLIDFGLFIAPINLSKYEYIKLPTVDTWGLVMKKNDKLAVKKAITFEDIKELPILGSRQAIKYKSATDEFNNWFKGGLDKLNIVGTYNLIYNAGIMVDAGLGYALTIDKLINTTSNSSLCFRPLKPKLVSELYIVWKKQQVFSPAAKLFLEKLQKDIN